MRTTYTISISSADPSILLYEIPNEKDFNDKFLTLADNLTVRDFMGFCFHKCYNYRQSKLTLPTVYINSSSNKVL